MFEGSSQNSFGVSINDNKIYFNIVGGENKKEMCFMDLEQWAKFLMFPQVFTLLQAKLQ